MKEEEGAVRFRPSFNCQQTDRQQYRQMEDFPADVGIVRYPRKHSQKKGGSQSQVLQEVRRLQLTIASSVSDQQQHPTQRERYSLQDIIPASSLT
jgi:hypothetical protein